MTEPVRTLTVAEHDRAWHAIEDVAEPDPGTILDAVLRALNIAAPSAEDEMAAILRKRPTARKHQPEACPAEARPPHVQWRVEYLRTIDHEPYWDNDHRAWDNPEKAQAEIDRYKGSSVQRRLVRETTTWTVEDETR